MSELVHYEYAPPRSWEQFEELCADLFEVLWSDPALARHGRAGQAQHGVDIVCSRGAVHPIGLQCKKKSRWPVTRITKKEVDREIENATCFTPALKEFYVLTTAVSDEKLQEHLRNLNVERRKQGQFTVEILFWSEIIRRVARHPAVAQKHFPVHGGSSFSPLLATWYAAGGKLEPQGNRWLLSVREVVEDFHDWPEGHVVVRQRESDVAIAELVNTPASTAETARKQRLELRRRIRRMRSIERDVEESIRLICTDPDLRFYIAELDESGNDAADTIRSVIESGFDSGRIDPSWQKIRISPPTPHRLDGPFTQASVAKADVPVFVPPDVYAAISRRECEFAIKHGNPIVRVVSELPCEARNRYVFPVLLQRLRRIMCEELKSIEQLRLASFLLVGSWKYEL